MKKNKTTEQPADFQNTPFTSLKKALPATMNRGKKTMPAPGRSKHVPAPEDEASLFLSAVEGVRKIDRSGTRLSSQTRQQSAAHTDSNAEKDERDFLQAMKKLGTNFHDHAEEPEAEEEGRCSQSSRLRQLKHGTIRISQELDLHGFLKDEALTQLGRFIAHAFNRGQNAVLVITGKGLNSPEGPVLQGAVAEWLRQKGKGMVAEFSAAPRGLGGSGAFVVFLKKK